MTRCKKSQREIQLKFATFTMVIKDTTHHKPIFKIEGYFSYPTFSIALQFFFIMLILWYFTLSISIF